MNKYKLISTSTLQVDICEKVEIDGFDYYISIDRIKKLNPGDKYWTIVENHRRVVQYPKHIQDSTSKVLICTNHPYSPVPRVIDVNYYADMNSLKYEYGYNPDFFIDGYNLSQQEYPFSKQEVCEFVEWLNLHYRDLEHTIEFKNAEGTLELLERWDTERIKTLFYE